MSDQNEKLDNLRHSTAHLLAASVMELWPETKRAIGPAIENGFYFDFDFGNNKISEEDFPKIEQKMREIAKTWKSFEKHELTPEEAKKEYPENPYKHELIEEFSRDGEKLSFYKSGDYWDLCRGGHSPHPNNDLKHFKLLSIAGAYWRGSEKNPMLTRIYGTAFRTKVELEEYLKMLEEAEKRDHKKLGKELGLFVFSETVGRGLPLFTPKGSTVRRELERFIVDEELKRGYLHVYTPDLARLALYEKSGHYPYYKDSMYAPIKIEDEEFMLRPMTCPHHFELFLSSPHSYRELPMRIAELAKLYRFEKSGELMGLQRVRTFCLADAHIITQKDKAENEVNEVLDLIEYAAGVLGLTHGENFHYRLSLGDRTDEKKYFKDDESWDYAEEALRKVLTERKANFVEAPGEAAFYGPKIDVQMKNVNGKEDTAFTVQYDFVMPKRFDLKFVNEKGEDEQPVVIHRSSIGAIERVMAFLIEHYAGAFPLWLASVQVAILPVSEKVEDYARKIYETVKEAGIRVEFDTSDKPIGAKIREATLQKIPFQCIIGEKERLQSEGVSDFFVSVRGREGDLGVQKLGDFLKGIKENIEKRK